MKIILGILLTWLSGSWAYVFFRIIRDGSYLMIEPVEWIIITEFIYAVLLVSFGIVITIWGVINEKAS